MARHASCRGGSGILPEIHGRDARATGPYRLSTASLPTAAARPGRKSDRPALPPAGQIAILTGGSGILPEIHGRDARATADAGSYTDG